MFEFKEIMFQSSYLCRRKAINAPWSSTRPDCQVGSGKILAEFVMTNKFKKIIDFGSWSGGSVICEAQGLSSLSNHVCSHDWPSQCRPRCRASAALQTTSTGKSWALHKNSKNFAGEIRVYDKFWDDMGQNGSMGNILSNIHEYDCYKNVQFIFQKVDMWDWLKDPEPFDLLHIDISHTPEEILKMAYALEEQINAGGVVLFAGGALRFAHAPFGSIIDEDGVDVSHTMTCFGDPINYRRLKATGLDFKILTQEFPGLMCIDRRTSTPRN